MGHQNLYSHQIESRNIIAHGTGADIVVTTPTSSGKSLCLTLPIFESIMCQKMRGDRSSTALFLFPLNALATNQLKSITNLNHNIEPKHRLRIESISGETNKQSIPDMFKQESYPDIVLTNPDWLHYQLHRGGASETWKGWRAWFSRLGFVVLDEAHTYSGVMGCHFINLLRRVTNYHAVLSDNADRLQFLLASATIGNPKQMTLKMLSRQDESKVQVIDRNGSGSFGKIYITLKSSKSPFHMPAMVIHNWVTNRIKGIVFCNTIRSVNGLIQHMSSDPKFTQSAKAVKAYYSSISAAVKQETLNQIKSGKTMVIISTNALEAGVDISELDACLVIGYPGSMMSWKQRVGRVGRSKKGLVVFISDNFSPLDKYYASNLQALVDGQTESLSFNGDFPTILSSHILGGSGIKDVVNAKAGDKMIEQMSKLQAISRLFPGALFVSHSSTGDIINYEVVGLDLGKQGEAGSANLQYKSLPRGTRITTQPIKSSSVEMIHLIKQKVIGFTGMDLELRLSFGQAKYTTTVSGFEKRTYNQKESDRARSILDDRFIGSSFESETLTLKQTLQVAYEAPALQFELLGNNTAPLREEFDKQVDQLRKALQTNIYLNRRDHEPKITDLEQMGEVLTGLHTMVHQILATVPTLLLTSRSDVEESIPMKPNKRNTFKTNRSMDTNELLDRPSSMFLVDSAEGGTGACNDIFDSLEEIVRKTIDMPPCPCAEENGLSDQLGCIFCLQSVNHCQKALLKSLGLSILDMTSVHQII
eukprot:gene11951-13927_t